MRDWREDLMAREPQSDVARLEEQIAALEAYSGTCLGAAVYWEAQYRKARATAWGLGLIAAGIIAALVVGR